MIIHWIVDLLAVASCIAIRSSTAHRLTTEPVKVLTTESNRPDFLTVRWCYGFVDKSLFVEEWLLHQDRHLYITAPPRFGKSTLLHTGKTFCAAKYTIVNGRFQETNRFDTPEYQAFKDLKIFTERRSFFDEHFMKYIVVKINFNFLAAVIDYGTFQSLLCEVIHAMVRPFEYLLECTNVPQKLKDFIQNFNVKGLSYCIDNFVRHGACTSPGEFAELLGKTFGKQVIFVGDEYDSFIHAHILNGEFIGRDSSIIRPQLGMFIGSAAEKEQNSVITKVLFTGTLNLGDVMSPLANTVQHKDFFYNENIAKFYGLCEQEVRDLLANFSLESHYDTVKTHFDGYAVLNSDLRLFNIVSVVKYLKVQNPDEIKRDFTMNSELWTNFNKIFLDYRIGSKVSRSIQTENVVDAKAFKIDNVAKLDFNDITALKKSIANRGSKPTFLTPFQTSIFFTYLVESGLYTVVKSDAHYRWIRPTNKEAREELIAELSKCEYFKQKYDRSEN